MSFFMHETLDTVPLHTCAQRFSLTFGHNGGRRA